MILAKSTDDEKSIWRRTPNCESLSKCRESKPNQDNFFLSDNKQKTKLTNPNRTFKSQENCKPCKAEGVVKMSRILAKDKVRKQLSFQNNLKIPYTPTVFLNAKNNISIFSKQPSRLIHFLSW